MRQPSSSSSSSSSPNSRYSSSGGKVRQSTLDKETQEAKERELVHDGEKDHGNGKKDHGDGEKDLEDGKKDLGDGKKNLGNGENYLADSNEYNHQEDEAEKQETNEKLHQGFGFLGSQQKENEGSPEGKLHIGPTSYVRDYQGVSNFGSPLLEENSVSSNKEAEAGGVEDSGIAFPFLHQGILGKS